MYDFQLFISLMFAAAILVGLSQKIHIPYPIALVLGGAAMGFNPLHQAVRLDPNLMLVVVLPPILYYAAFGISFRELKKNWKDVLSLAFGLVLLTTCIVAVIFKTLFPEFSWALAFAFGALISPPDAIAATTILKQFSFNNRLLTILEGESLVNDASALVLYKLALTALFMGSFSLTDSSFEFVRVSIGGIAIGLALGYIMQRFSSHYLEPVVGVVFSFTIPYITYILALNLDVSGVLAVVANGFVGSKILMRHQSSLRRILGFATWDIFIILLNCFVFIMIGLSLQTLSQTMTRHQMLLYTAYAAIITVVMMLVRMAWVYARSALTYIKALKSPNSDKLCPQILGENAIVGWSSMRGIVSLVAGLALPYQLPDGTPLEGRGEVIFITFVIILLTLVIPGLSLPSLVRWLKMPIHSDDLNHLEAHQKLLNIAGNAISHLQIGEKIDDKESAFLRTYFDLKLHGLKTSSMSKSILGLDGARSLIIQEQRKELIKIWEKFEIDDKQFNLLAHELDLEEIYFARAELK